jgi:hypothetical protein
MPGAYLSRLLFLLPMLQFHHSNTGGFDRFGGTLNVKQDERVAIDRLGRDYEQCQRGIIWMVLREPSQSRSQQQLIIANDWIK